MAAVLFVELPSANNDAAVDRHPRRRFCRKFVPARAGFVLTRLCVSRLSSASKMTCARARQFRAERHVITGGNDARTLAAGARRVLREPRRSRLGEILVA